MGKSHFNDCLLVGIRLVPDTDSLPSVHHGNHGTSGQHPSSGYGSINSLLSAGIDPHYNSKVTTSDSLITATSHLALMRLNSKHNCQRIGLVVCHHTSHHISLLAFRDLMIKQIARLPKSFVFLSTRGLCISKEQEALVPLKNIISEDGCVDIQKHFDTPRYGIVNANGDCYGFIFVEPDASAKVIRNHILQLLEQLDTGQQSAQTFRLMDRNGWPLSADQELALSGWDLIRNDCIRLTSIKSEPAHFDTDDELSFDHKLHLRNASTITLTDEVPVTSVHECAEDMMDMSHYSLSMVPAPNHQVYGNPSCTLTGNSNSFTSNTSYGLSPSIGYQHTCACLSDNHANDETIVLSTPMQSAHKPILISYVRKEAEQHARRLKSKLINLGLEVFLDVDEITVGNDWQDSLNNAVANCEIFVPLITPNYGLTLWTNREIKFADMKKKIIVPINFLSTWPPECLAIQFATTQFLPWKTMEEIDREYETEGERAFDIRVWDDRFIIRTAQQISQLVKKKSLARTLLNNEMQVSMGPDTNGELNELNELNGSNESNISNESDTVRESDATCDLPYVDQNKQMDPSPSGPPTNSHMCLANAFDTLDEQDQMGRVKVTTDVIPKSGMTGKQINKGLTYAETLIAKSPNCKTTVASGNNGKGSNDESNKTGSNHLTSINRVVLRSRLGINPIRYYANQGPPAVEYDDADHGHQGNQSDQGDHHGQDQVDEDAKDAKGAMDANEAKDKKDTNDQTTSSISRSGSHGQVSCLDLNVSLANYTKDERTMDGGAGATGTSHVGTGVRTGTSITSINRNHNNAFSNQVQPRRASESTESIGNCSIQAHENQWPLLPCAGNQDHDEGTLETQQATQQATQPATQQTTQSAHPSTTVSTSSCQTSVHDHHASNHQPDPQSQQMLVVISAHPQQTNAVQQLRRHLSNKYQIWSSTDMCTEDNVDSTCVDTFKANTSQTGSVGAGLDETKRIRSKRWSNWCALRSNSVVDTCGELSNRSCWFSSLLNKSSINTGSEQTNASTGNGSQTTHESTGVLWTGKSRCSGTSQSVCSSLSEQTIQEHLEKATEFVIPEQKTGSQADARAVPTSAGCVESNKHVVRKLEIPCESVLQMDLETSAAIDLNAIGQWSYCQKVCTSANHHQPHHHQHQHHQQQQQQRHHASRLSSSAGSSSNQDTGGRRQAHHSWYGCAAIGEHMSSSLPPNEIGKVNIFKQKVNQARIVIILLSEAYCQSRTCKRQAFYCDFRKQVLPIQIEPVSDVPHWVSKLMYSPDLIGPPAQCGVWPDDGFYANVSTKLSAIIRCDERVNALALDDHSRFLAALFERTLALNQRSQLFVYVVGSTKIKRCENQSVCIKIGQALAAHEHLVLVTGGNAGVADVIARSFYQERMRLNQDRTAVDTCIKMASDTQLDEATEVDHERWNVLRDPSHRLHVLHVLPRLDTSARANKYERNADGSFKAPAYGHCVRVGDSLQERDSLVARTFGFCVLVEGGAGSAKLAQEFAYHENFVVPVCCTGGAAAGKFITQEFCHDITDVPAGVDEQDWAKLRSRTQSSQLGHTIVSIIGQLSKYQAAKRCQMVDNVEHRPSECKRNSIHNMYHGPSHNNHNIHNNHNNHNNKDNTDDVNCVNANSSTTHVIQKNKNTNCTASNECLRKDSSSIKYVDDRLPKCNKPESNLNLKTNSDL